MIHGALSAMTVHLARECSLLRLVLLPVFGAGLHVRRQERETKFTGELPGYSQFSLGE